jgi:hypothetical protein
VYVRNDLLPITGLFNFLPEKEPLFIDNMNVIDIREFYGAARRRTFHD